MAKTLYDSGGLGILHRFCTVEKAIKDFKAVNEEINMCKPALFPPIKDPNYTVGVSIGVKEEDKERFTKLYEAGARLFCIDIAHGHSLLMKRMIEFIKNQNLKNVIIIAGNVATAYGAKQLKEWGADIIKVGIGPGCFTPEMKIKTNKGLKCIKDIKNGDNVISHTGNYNEVISTIKYNIDEEIIEVNGIESTKRHEYYVIDKKDQQFVNDLNIHNYAKWVKAKDLTNNYLLVEVIDD